LGFFALFSICKAYLSGDDRVQSTDSLILEVPSAVVPIENNYLINPGNPDFDEITFDEPRPVLQRIFPVCSGLWVHNLGENVPQFQSTPPAF
jgi:hypothetical protein